MKGLLLTTNTRCDGCEAILTGAAATKGICSQCQNWLTHFGTYRPVVSLSEPQISFASRLALHGLKPVEMPAVTPEIGIACGHCGSTTKFREAPACRYCGESFPVPEKVDPLTAQLRALPPRYVTALYASVLELTYRSLEGHSLLTRQAHPHVETSGKYLSNDMQSTMNELERALWEVRERNKNWEIHDNALDN